MKAAMQTMGRLLDNPYVNLAVGVILLVGGLTEIWETLSEDLATLHLRGMHGVTLFGLVKGLQAIPDFFEGLDSINAANQRR
jgi:hypothetical protein